MSSSSTPNRSPQPGSGTHTPRVPITRTVGIIKAHALKHRLTIERSIVDAGFEIVKERQMAFDPEGSRDVLIELFGRDARSLGEDPVWVYVLERRRAVEVWLTLMGPEDPEVARVEQPNSLRAIYGVDSFNNAFIGSPDPSTAEAQIETLFASSPPFPTADESGDELDQDPMLLSPPMRPANGRQYDSVRSLNSVGSQRSSVSSKSPSNGRLANGANTGFKARPMPASTAAAPEITPRLTRAASLRIGLPPEQTRKPTLRATRTKEEQQAAFMDVPGHKRSAPIAVASTAAPTIAPRATKASVLRETKDLLGAKPTWGTARKETVETYDRPKAGVANYENVPGHKRRESITVASTAAPTVAPRANRAAELRAAKMANSNNTAPTSFKAGGPPPTRRQSTSALADKPSSMSAASGRAAANILRTAASPAPGPAPRPSVARAPPSAFSNGRGAAGAASGGSSRASSSLGDAPALRRSVSALDGSVSTAKQPDIVPRTNRSALLREKAKLDAQKAAARARAF